MVCSLDRFYKKLYCICFKGRYFSSVKKIRFIRSNIFKLIYAFKNNIHTNKLSRLITLSSVFYKISPPL